MDISTIIQFVEAFPARLEVLEQRLAALEKAAAPAQPAPAPEPAPQEKPVESSVPQQ